ncbi:EAL domain-containing protein [Alteromonas sp. ASW11-130]|uniref:EAL domain-containing protein n=1 Tax=Alteromonas sp. ASW11-130 TaxID=3015775 RepID=UPI002241F27C|nr:EAL domain-containing protein [Alteromonas sp. ASW11-130]MCW8090265.1 EAL domain-containing protein [Alteromonas sp. ASW11-130]
MKYGLAFLIVLFWTFASNAEPVVPNPTFKYLSSKHGLSQDNVNKVAIDQDGFVWLATDGGLNRWDGYRNEVIPGPNNVFINASIKSLFIDSKNDLWVSTAGNGIFRYDLYENEVENVIRRAYSESARWIQSANGFFESRPGELIIALDEEVVRYNSRRDEITVLYQFPESALETEQSIRVASLYQSVLFIGATHKFLAIDLNQKDARPKEIDYLGDVTPTLDNINVKHFLLDENKRFWVGTVEGLFETNLEELVNYVRHGNAAPTFNHIIRELNIWEQVEDIDGSFWLGTNIGLVKLETSQGKWQWHQLLEPDNEKIKLSNTSIKTIAIDVAGNLWLGSVNGGALYWSPKTLSIKTIQNGINNETILSDNAVWSFWQQDSEFLWVGTENGLTRLNLATDKSDFYLTRGNKKFYDSVLVERIFPAPQDKLIVQTYDSLKLFDRKSNSLTSLPTQSTQSAKVFNQFIYGAGRDSQGRIYFIADKYYRYDPQQQLLESLPLPESEFDPRFGASFLNESSHYKGEIFLSTLDGLWLIDTETFSTRSVFRFTQDQKNNDAAISSYAIAKGKLWVAFPRYGIFGLDAKTFEIKNKINEKNLLLSNIVYGLTVDKNDNLWFGSHSGLHHYSITKHLLKNYRYGKELAVSEFNEGAALKLNDDRLVFGSTNGMLLFAPEKILQDAEESRYSMPLVITSVELDSRPLNTAMKNLSSGHFDLDYTDFGMTINFSANMSSLAGDLQYRYRLIREGKVVSEGVTREPRITFGSFSAGSYRFEVAPDKQHVDFTLLPAAISFNMPYAPFQSPVAIGSFIVLGMLFVAIYLQHRHNQILRLNRAQKQVRLFGEAFKQTRDWVVIFDEKKDPLAINPAFETIFGLSSGKDLVKQFQRLYKRFPNLEHQFDERLNSLSAGDYVKEEGQVEGSDGQKYDVLIDITAVSDETTADKIDHFLMVFSDISIQKDAERKLLKIANYDALTGLVNRSLLLDRLDHGIAYARRHNTQVAVLFVDLDRFKGINDSLGHDYGDKLLMVVANRMLNIASEDDTVARLGGDEFVIVLEGVAGFEAISPIVTRLIEAIEMPISIGKEVLRVSCSIGISFYPDDGKDSSELLKQADVAMYSAKKDTLSGFTYYTQEMNEVAKNRLQLENLVKLAWQEQGFFNYYQPIVNTTSGTTEGVELLLRCRVQSTTIGPNEFIPVLEQLRYIIDATRFAMERGVEDLKLWYDQGFTGYMSVNLSALHFKTEFDLDSVVQLLKEHDLPVSALRFEITEGVLIDNADDALRQVKRFQDAGFVLALDDFGTGYSSLSYLKKFPLNVLKIDKTFVDDVNEENVDQALVIATINLANKLKLQCVAEGIETEFQAQYLADNWCTSQQGYYYSEPVAANDVAELLFRRW